MLASGLTLMHCASSEDTSVTVDTACDVGKLNATFAGEATLQAYLQTAEQFKAKASSLELRMKDVCNQLNRDLGIPEGANMRDACNTVAARVAAANKRAPDPKNGSRPVWVAMQFKTACDPDPTAEAKCVDSCSGKPPCNVAAACPPDKLVGTCPGVCTGTCAGAAATTAQECVGECEGEATILDAGTPLTCGAECRGTCPAARWLARCAAGCTQGFVGDCLGTCTGTCDGMPLGVLPDLDAGPEAGVDAAPPTGADGNCKGLCVGLCSANASGACTAKCTGGFAGGACPPCVGACASPGQASVAGLSTCRGTCRFVSGAATCAGSCSGGCSVGYANPACTVGLNCEADDECKRTCRLQGVMASKCVPMAEVDLRVAGDFKLYDALKKNGPAIAALFNEVSALGPALERARDRTTGNYLAIGVRRDVGLRCVEQGTATLSAGAETFRKVVSASQFIKGDAL